MNYQKNRHTIKRKRGHASRITLKPKNRILHWRRSITVLGNNKTKQQFLYFFLYSSLLLLGQQPATHRIKDNAKEATKKKRILFLNVESKRRQDESSERIVQISRPEATLRRSGGLRRGGAFFFSILNISIFSCRPGGADVCPPLFGARFNAGHSPNHRYYTNKRLNVQLFAVALQFRDIF